MELISKINNILNDNTLTFDDKNKKIFDLITNITDKSELIQEVKSNHNLINSNIISKLINNGVFSIKELLLADIEIDFIRALFENKEPIPMLSQEPINFNKEKSTEIYFFGLPLSGKTSVLGAIFSTINSDFKIDIKPCVGYSSNMLSFLLHSFQKNIINRSIDTSRDTNSVSVLNFNLLESNEACHPITIVNVGERLIYSLYKFTVGEEHIQEIQRNINILTTLFTQNNNKKIFVFVISYELKENIYSGVPEAIYLQSVISFLKKKNFFNKNIRSIYLMITNMDKLKINTSLDVNNYAKVHYMAIFNELTQVCKDYEINKGVVNIIPFTFGELCFQDYFRFDSTDAENFIKNVLERTPTKRKNVFKRIFKI